MSEANTTPEPARRENPTHLERLWTVRDVQEYFRASESWVRHAVSVGKLPCVKVGGLLRFEPRVIRGMVEQAPQQAVRRPTRVRA